MVLKRYITLILVNFWLNFHFTNFIKRLTNECLDVIILM